MTIPIGNVYFMNSLTIDQCVEQINARLAEEGLVASMNVRLLRHYQQQKSIPAPTQEGRFAKYSDEHVEAVVELRKAQDMGVSSKAYTTIANIEKHADPRATVASLGLDTPAWLANSVVGAVSSASASPSALDLFNSGLDNARAFSNIKIEPAKSKSLMASSPMPATNAKKSGSAALHGSAQPESMAFAAFSSEAPMESLDTSFGASLESVAPMDAKSAALRALQNLSPIPQSAPSPANISNKLNMTTARTMSTLARVVSSPNMPAPIAAAVDTAPSPKIAKFASSEITEWTLDHDVCVQIPSAALGFMSQDALQAFEAWMAQLPDLK